MADPGDTTTGAGGPAGHATHDLERIAALLDADLSSADRMAGEAMAASCPDCARLRDDLFALAGATAEMPAPVRNRDFRLTPADAARLASIGSGEPSAGAARLTDDMFDPRITAGHPAHDTTLVAALIDRSIPTAERDAAQRMVDTCRLCAELHADLLALRTATRALPTPPRPRDYYLSAADAERLRPSGLRRWIVAIGSSRDAFTRPLAIGLTTLGIVGLLVSGAPLVSFGSATSGGPTSAAAGGAGAASAPQPAASQPAMDVAAPAASAGAAAAEGTAASNADAAGSAAPVFAPVPIVPGLPPAASPAPANGSPEFLGDQGGRTSGAKASAPLPGRQPDQAVAAPGQQPAEPASGLPPVVVVSVVLLAGGLGLFLLRWMARSVGT